MPDPAEVALGGAGVTGGRGHGKDARTYVQVNAGIKTRIIAVVEAGLRTPAHTSLAKATKATEARGAAQRGATVTAMKIPARVAVGIMGSHRSRLAVRAGGDGGGGRAMLADFAGAWTLRAPTSRLSTSARAACSV